MSNTIGPSLANQHIMKEMLSRIIRIKITRLILLLLLGVFSRKKVPIWTLNMVVVEAIISMLFSILE
jgi:hypothetical protein